MATPLLDVTCLECVLRPVIRFCLRHSFQVQDLRHCAKRLFLELAQEEAHKTGFDENVSRLSATTGLHRTEIAEMLTIPAREKKLIGLTARLVGQWTADKRFLTSKGKPRVLSFRGKESGFADLVQSVTPSITPAAALFELERLQIVERTQRGLKLKRQIVWLQQDIHQGFELLAADVETLTQTVEENLLGQPPRDHLHLRTEYDNLFLANLPEIHNWLAQKGRALHREVREYLSKFDKDIAEPREQPAGGRVILGTFAFTEIPPTEDSNDD